MDGSTIIRPARPSDAWRLSQLGAATFREAFEAENAPEDIAHYVAEAFAPDRQAAEIADPAGTVLVSERLDGSGGGEADMVGYAHLVSGPAPAVVPGASPLELKRFYVASAWHGRGVAHSLMEAVLTTARARSADALWLGVWERNPRAAAFYRKYGFARYGEHAFLLGSDPQIDWILALPLGDASGASRGAAE